MTKTAAPDLPTVRVEQFAALTGSTLSRIEHLVSLGMPAEGAGRGRRIPLTTALPWLFELLESDCGASYPPTLLSVREFAELVLTSHTTVSRWIADGLLPGVRRVAGRGRKFEIDVGQALPAALDIMFPHRHGGG